MRLYEPLISVGSVGGGMREFREKQEESCLSTAEVRRNLVGEKTAAHRAGNNL